MIGSALLKQEQMQQVAGARRSGYLAGPAASIALVMRVRRSLLHHDFLTKDLQYMKKSQSINQDAH